MRLQDSTITRLARALLALLILAISALAFMPAPPSELELPWDKANHAAAFAVLMAVAMVAFRMGPRRIPLLAAALLGYGAFIELVQSQLPSRTAEWGDVLADAAGIALGAALMALVERWARGRAR